MMDKFMFYLLYFWIELIYGSFADWLEFGKWEWPKYNKYHR